jgi:hypothetical protein
MRSVDAATREAITKAAQEAGIDPSAALAIAERESNFNTRARNSKTIRGLQQMRGDLRDKYGVGDSDDPYVQTKGWGAFFKDVKREMAGKLGRDPTDAEGYLGHHFGGVRAARMMQMDPATPVDSVFTPTEMAANPHFAKAGTVGALNSSVLSDISKRQTKFGGAGDAPDFSAFGKLASLDQPSTAADPNLALEERKFSAPEAPDFSPFGTPADDHQPSVQPPLGAPDFSQFGTPA